MSKRFRSIPREKLVPLPENIDIPREILASRVKIPSMYAGGDVEYEDAEGNAVDKDKATHIRLTGIDIISDIVVWSIEPSECSDYYTLMTIICLKLRKELQKAEVKFLMKNISP